MKQVYALWASPPISPKNYVAAIPITALDLCHKQPFI